MEWQKTPEAVADAFAAALPSDSRVERRKMFGYPAAFVGGNMFAGTYASDIVVKLGASGGGLAEFEPMPGRKMGGFYVVPRDASQLPGLLKAAFDYVASLPPKGSKTTRAKR